MAASIGIGIKYQMTWRKWKTAGSVAKASKAKNGGRKRWRNIGEMASCWRKSAMACRNISANKIAVALCISENVGGNMAMAANIEN